MHYTGTLEDGTEFDSSRSRGEPIDFKLGGGSMIRGWDVVVASMKKGERVQARLAPEYAYGAEGRPPSIPPSATLVRCCPADVQRYWKRSCGVEGCVAQPAAVIALKSVPSSSVSCHGLSSKRRTHIGLSDASVV